MSDFLKANADKVLLAAFVIYLSLLIDQPTRATWATKTADMITGALLTLITGGRLLQRRVDTEGGGTDPESGKVSPKTVKTTELSTNQQGSSSTERRSTDGEAIPVEVVNPDNQPVPVSEKPSTKKKGKKP